MTQHKPYIVVVGVDFSETGDVALAHAFERASDAYEGELHVINVARAYGPMVHLEIGGEIETLSMEEASARLKEFVESRLEAFVRAREAAKLPVFARAVTHLRLDAPAEEIAQLASDLEADLVIVGTHGRRGMRRLLLGSVAEGVVRLAPCPVLVVRPKNEEARVPDIEPPCQDCVKVRQETGGEQLWCARHSEHHGRPHTYHYVHRNVSSRDSMPMLTPMNK
ncbi:MAG: universal stress protein [Polyangiaceae bacterium]